MPRSVSKSQFALLGILAGREASGYELRRFIAQSIGHFWQESFGQIYPALKDMKKKGWINTVDAAVGLKTRQRHRITPKGRKALAAWLATPPAPEVIRNEMLLKLFFGGHANPGIMLQHLEAQRLQVLEMQVALQRITPLVSDPQEINAAYWRLTLDYGKKAVEAELSWLDESLKKLRENNHRGKN